ncbi:MAG: hypothetical protein RLZZ522_2174 [Verrucomicrobiota bacterium]|jgi:hypothetical protein
MSDKPNDPSPADFEGRRKILVRSAPVEWCIVIFIVCEIALALYEMFIRGR